MTRRVLAVLATSVVVSGVTATAALAEYPPTTTTGSVSATEVVPGGSVMFTGDGFKLGSGVTVKVNDTLYANVTAKSVGTAALNSASHVHFTNAAYVRDAAAASGGFSVSVTLKAAGANVLTGVGVDPAGKPHVVTAKVTVAEAAVAPVVTKPSSLPFTGSEVVIPGAIVGLAMMGGGFLLLTTVRSRRAGQARS